MRILTRYILKEFLVPLFYCLAGFVSIYVLFELFGSFSRIMEAGIGFPTVLRYFCGYLAPYFHYLAPAALMLATIYTMWVFCRHSEIVAMRASGVSFFVIARPILAVALALAGAVVWVNEWYVPRHAHWAAQMKSFKFEAAKVEKSENIVYRNSPQHRTWNVIALEDDTARRLRGVRVTVDRVNGQRLMTVEADSASYMDGEWWFSHPKVQHYDDRGREKASSTAGLDTLGMRCFEGFDETPTDFILQNRPWKFNSVADRFHYLDTHPELSPAARHERLYDIWAQIAAPWACLVIALFAIPAGIASGRQSVFKGVLGALGLYFAFYGVSIGCMIVAKNGLVNPIVGAFLPDVVFLALGIRSFLRQI